MPKNAYIHPDDLPIDLQLDLLVDGELTEVRRRELLREIDRQPAQWRDVALRFLTQQTEKQSIKALMQGGNLIPVDLAPPTLKKPVIGRIGWYRISGIAAAIAIAAGSALVTLWVTRNPTITPTNTNIAAREHKTSLAADITGAPAPLAISVPVVPAASGDAVFPVSTGNNSRASKTSYQVESDGKGGVIIIPVSTSNTPVY